MVPQRPRGEAQHVANVPGLRYPPPDMVPSPQRRAPLLVGLFVLAVLAMLLQDGSIPHLHLASQPGLYNHDHDLGSLATVGSGLVPDVPAAVLLVAAVLVVALARPAPPESAPIGHADSRAPPAS